MAACLAVTGVSASTVEFFDGDFDNNNWTATKVTDTTAGMEASFTAQREAIGGNPSAFRQVTHTFGLGSISVSHIYAAESYDPSMSGAISLIDYSYDLIHINPPPSQAVRYILVLTQSDTIYLPPGDLIFDNVWTSFGMSGLVAADFTRAIGLGPDHPDFSNSGAPISFGYWSSNTNSGGATEITRTSGIDNWRVGVHPVPLPGTVLLFLSGLIGLIINSRRKDT